jgi:hypothetical protein
MITVNTLTLNLVRLSWRTYLQALLLYFISIFQREALSKSMDRARRQHIEGYDPYAVAAKLQACLGSGQGPLFLDNTSLCSGQSI